MFVKSHPKVHPKWVVLGAVLGAVFSPKTYIQTPKIHGKPRAVAGFGFTNTPSFYTQTPKKGLGVSFPTLGGNSPTQHPVWGLVEGYLQTKTHCFVSTGRRHLFQRVPHFEGSRNAPTRARGTK